MDLFHGNVIQIDPIQAAHVDGPQVWRGAWPAKGKHAADWAEVIFGGVGMPLVEGQVIQQGQDAQLGLVHAVVERTPLAADGTVTDPDVVEIEANFKLNVTAVAGACVGLEHF